MLLTGHGVIASHLFIRAILMTATPLQDAFQHVERDKKEQKKNKYLAIILAITKADSPYTIVSS